MDFHKEVKKREEEKFIITKEIHLALMSHLNRQLKLWDFAESIAERRMGTYVKK